MDKLLIIGSSGLVGSRLAFLAPRHGFEAYNTTNSRTTTFPRSTQLDITNREATQDTIGRIRPSCIINTAAITNVDYCETHMDETRAINVEGVGHLAEAAEGRKIRFVQISTDYVFDGAFGHYTESDAPKPLNHYARTKVDAEKIVSELPTYAIARPSVIYGWNPPETSGASSASGKPMNFAMFVLDKLKKSEAVKAVRDQYSSPTFVDNLAEALLRLASHRENGIFHTAGRSCLSRYEFAAQLANVFGYSTELVQPVLSSEFKQLAERPKNSCLNVEKAEKILGMRFLTAEEGLREMKKQTSTRVERPRYGPTCGEACSSRKALMSSGPLLSRRSKVFAPHQGS